jgi:hypothetical protein
MFPQVKAELMWPCDLDGVAPLYKTRKQQQRSSSDRCSSLSACMLAGTAVLTAIDRRIRQFSDDVTDRHVSIKITRSLVPENSSRSHLRSHIVCQKTLEKAR